MRHLDFNVARLCGETFLFLVSASKLRTIPGDERWEHLAAALGWIMVVCWAGRLMGLGTAPALFGGSGLLQAIGDVTERLALLQGGGTGIHIAWTLDLIGVGFSVVALVFMLRERSKG